MSGLRQDIRFAIRLLARDRTFTVTALATLALCIGANMAMFGIVRSVVLKPLPFPDSERIVFLYNSYPNAGAARAGAFVPDYFDRLVSVPALDEQGLYRPESMTFGDENGAERLTSLRATPSFYRLVRVQPLHGRLFRDDEGERGRALKVILGYAFWQRKFAGDPSIVGRTIRLNGNPFDVVGIMPRAFSFLNNTTDLYVPSPIGPADKRDDARHSNNWQMIGHLRAGASVPQVQAQIDALNAANDSRFPQFRQILKDANFHTVAVLLQDDVVRDVKRVLFLLWGGVLFVLLIGCVNIANLVIVRSAARAREMATRHAIGGNLSRLARQIMTETIVLASSGGALGVLCGWWTLKSVAALDLDKLPRGYEVSLDPPTVLVALGLALLVGAALGLGPALALRRMDLNTELQAEGRGSTSSRRASLVRRLLATSQVAIAFVLLVGAGLLLASFRAVLRMDLGFQPAQVVTATVTLPATSYQDGSSLVTFERRALEAIRARPDVLSAGIVSTVPFSGALTNSVIAAEGYEMKRGESLVAPNQSIASPGYFESMRIPIVSGRGFDDRDGAASAGVVIVDERLARRFWPERDPIGRRMYFPEDPSQPSKTTAGTEFLTVVGIAREVQAVDPRAEFAPVGTYYLSYEQVTARTFTFTVRTRSPARTILPAIRQHVAAIDPQIPLFRPRPMQEWIDRALVARRVPMLIASAFGLLALLLSGVGIYGVLACSVSQRQRELGIRMALGSTTAGIFGLVLREGAKIIASGLIVGLGGAAFIGRLMKAQLYGVRSGDPAIIAGMAGTLTMIALVAIVIPSWRAARINPTVALNG
jgi:putative ABC transport system permease protein